ncbi:MAG: DivIVA domain-containing protein [Actinomycetota bacterium]
MADDEAEQDDWPDEADDQPTEDGDDSGGLSPEDVAFRSFSAARRGVSEGEVREFLQEVAAEMAEAVGRERDLLAQIHEREERIARLERRIAHPPPPTEEQALDYLGEETARVLRSAQEAADEIRSKANARAQAIVEQAENEAARVREAANSTLSERAREADIASTVTLREAEGRAQGLLRQAARDGEAEIEAARQRGREMVGEARAVRERILADLGKRRAALQAELAELEAAREGIHESTRAVRQQLTDAVKALTPLQEQVVGELEDALDELAPDEPLGEALEDETDEDEESTDEKSVGAWPALELVEKPEESEEPEELPSTDDAEELRGSGERPEGPATGIPAPERVRPEEEEEPEPEVPEFVEPPPEVPDFVAPAAARVEPEKPKVEEVFARIRAGREDAVGEARAVLAPEPVAAEPAPAEDVAAEVETEPEPPGPVPLTGDARRLSHRDEVLAPVSQDLLRRCKRALQDEQNELLDRLRRERGGTGAEQLLAPLSAQVTDWADVLEPAVNEAYGAGRGSQTADEGQAESAPRRLVSGLAEVLVTPLRERLVSTLDSVEGVAGSDLEAELSTRVGARYREWRAQELEYRVGDVLAAAYARGVYDAAPEGSQLRWIPAQVGQCPDADDNALEPTTRGSNFPTGQPFPPAHPGCRCLIAVADTD